MAFPKRTCTLVNGLLIGFTLCIGLSPSILAQSDSEILFREDWAEIPAAVPITQEHVASSGLLLARYGPGGDKIKKSHHPDIPNDPYYVWSGATDANWMLTLRPGRRIMDLTGDARVRWRGRQSGFHTLHLTVKLRDGTWLISDQRQAATDDWEVYTFRLDEVTWRQLDPETITEGRQPEAIDLSNVVEIGFTDLMRGGRSPASSRVDWIEVVGRWVPMEGSG